MKLRLHPFKVSAMKFVEHGWLMKLGAGWACAKPHFLLYVGNN